MDIQRAKELVKHNKIEQIGKVFVIDERHKVMEVVKKGRGLLICDCCNDTKFCIESPICVHKLAVILFLADNKFNKKIDKLIEDYKKFDELKLPVSVYCFLNDLENLRRIK